MRTMQHWKPYEPNDSLPWNLRRAKHLHRRASLGATWSELQRDLDDGHENSISRLLAGNSRIDGLRDDFDEISTIIGDAAAGSNDPNRLKAWWLFRMLFTPDPLREKLTLLWHNHFATSNLKVQDLSLMRLQNELFRSQAMSKFDQLLLAVLQDPAMLLWLDANSNRKGHPNENLARELMELFTLGVSQYSEDDVKAAARALTGWSVKRAEVNFRDDRHDAGVKTILGKTDRFDMHGFAKLLLTHEATSRRVVWRLCTMFMGEDVVDDQALTELAAGLREHDLDIRWAVETILRSELFFADANIASRINSPVEFLVGAVRSLELLDEPPSTLILAEWCSRLGQDLFYPPNVGGWNGGRDWLTSRTIVARANFAAAMVAGELRAPASPPDFEQLANRYWDQNDTKRRDALESLLLSVSCGHNLPRGVGSTNLLVAHLLSCAEAHLT